MLTFVIGGARSGKSRWAEELARASGARVTYVATGLAGDGEMRRRIAEHRRRRPAEWETVEEPVAVDAVLAARDQEGRLLLVDCLSFLVFNLLERAEPGAGGAARRRAVLGPVARLADRAAAASAQVIVVSDEVGWGVVPDTPLGREYRDLLGEANQLFAARAASVYAVIAGIPWKIKG